MMRIVLIALGALLLLPSLAQAQSTRDFIIDTVITEVEKRVIRDYFNRNQTTTSPTQWQQPEEPRKPKKHKGKGKGKNKNKGMPHGLAKRDSLPPGLQRQYERNGTLPPGLAKRQMPDRLESRLPMRPPTQERVIVDNDVLLVQRGTGIILDILENVIRENIN